MRVRLKALDVRGRLLRRVFYRFWKFHITNSAKKLVHRVDYASKDEIDISVPSILLSTFSKPEDSRILMMLFSNYDLVWLVPGRLSEDSSFNMLTRMGRTLVFDPERLGYSFFRKLLSALKQFNRSIVMLPEGAEQYFKKFNFDYDFLAKLAIKSNVPVLPVVIQWNSGNRSPQKCNVLIGEKIFISPRHPDFKDIFFRKRASRKYSRLSSEEFGEVGMRLSNKFEAMKRDYGSDIS